ncbi:MAG: ATP-dependent zinc metalloprotease FtsH [Desulfurella sp.]|uniref:ATP-dependent zinc metalloprotease FtsH n=1 Tax=Desulfurella sp. TaxID=1962857 RepID=UPI000CAA8EDC|nr:ATP-dependent zinc metalloprotease FtsH [Desulfurella sp.]PMP93576.1 MAG: cell division protein FtsH [Desulfurella sp.]HEX13716.1 ATP-dependent metallopeptidase FtsH/Yme1/Tma family protein [Desulfurella acetivorans]
MQNNNDEQKPNKENNYQNLIKFSLFYLLIGLLAIYFYQSYFAQEKKTLTYSEFKSLVAKNRVISCEISSQYIKGEYLNDKNKKESFVTIAVNDPNLVKDLEEHHVNFSGTISNTWLTNLIFGWILPFGLLFFLWWFMTRKIRGSSGSIFGFGKGRFKVYLNKRPDVKFSDVAGIDEVKYEVEEIVEFLKNPGKYQRLGGRIPKGVLLVGAPGTGKTLLAKATAGEAEVPFLSISGSEFIEMFVGVGASRVRDLFQEAKKLAPCIVFIDEIDTIGKSRAINTITSNDEREQTLNQLLAEMDGFESNLGVIIMAATNRPEILDPALLRPGRFDRQIIVDKPNVNGREAIFKVHVRKIKLDPDVDIKKLAQMTPGLVGADIENIVNEAALLAARENSETVNMRHFEEAIERQIAGLKKQNRAMREEEKKRVAVHESGHAIIAYLLPNVDKVHKISIIPRGVAALGYTQQLPTDDRYLITKQEMLNMIKVLFGGRIAEELVLKDVSTGAQNDLSRATDIARSIVTKFGMSETIGLVVLEDPAKSRFLGTENIFTQKDEISEKTKEAVDTEINKILNDCYKEAKEMLENNIDKLEKLTSLLLEKEEINEEELKKVMESENV